MDERELRGNDLLSISTQPDVAANTLQPLGLVESLQALLLASTVDSKTIDSAQALQTAFPRFQEAAAVVAKEVRKFAGRRKIGENMYELALRYPQGTNPADLDSTTPDQLHFEKVWQPYEDLANSGITQPRMAHRMLLQERGTIPNILSFDMAITLQPSADEISQGLSTGAYHMSSDTQRWIDSTPESSYTTDRVGISILSGRCISEIGNGKEVNSPAAFDHAASTISTFSRELIKWLGYEYGLKGQALPAIPGPDSQLPSI